MGFVSAVRLGITSLKHMCLCVTCAVHAGCSVCHQSMVCLRFLACLCAWWVGLVLGIVLGGWGEWVRGCNEGGIPCIPSQSS